MRNLGKFYQVQVQSGAVFNTAIYIFDKVSTDDKKEEKKQFAALVKLVVKTASESISNAQNKMKVDDKERLQLCLNLK